MEYMYIESFWIQADLYAPLLLRRVFVLTRSIYIQWLFAAVDLVPLLPSAVRFQSLLCFG